MRYWVLTPHYRGNEKNLTRHWVAGTERDLKWQTLWCELAYDIDKSEITVQRITKQEYTEQYGVKQGPFPPKAPRRKLVK